MMEARSVPCRFLAKCKEVCLDVRVGDIEGLIHLACRALLAGGGQRRVPRIVPEIDGYMSTGNVPKTCMLCSTLHAAICLQNSDTEGFICGFPREMNTGQLVTGLEEQEARLVLLRHKKLQGQAGHRALGVLSTTPTLWKLLPMSSLICRRSAPSTELKLKAFA